MRAYAQRKDLRGILRNTQSVLTPGREANTPPAAPPRPVVSVDRAETTAPVPPTSKGPLAMVLIGVSTGGPNALARVLPALPANLGLPVLVVQHMPAIFTRTLAESLDKQCALRVKEAEHNEIAHPNTVYIAPGGHHMKTSIGPGGLPLIQISDDPPENNCRPSVDTLFRSAAHHFPGRVCAVIMTGMGSDGTLGLRLIKRHPAKVIAQDEASCVVFGMPKEAITAGVVDIVSPLDGIAGEIRKIVSGGSHL